MATFETIKAKLAALLSGANQTTGNPDTTLTQAVTRLRDGYGKGAVTEPLTATENGTYYPSDGVDGFDQVDVNVDTAPAYNMGYEDGHRNGFNDGDASGYERGFAEGRSPEQSSASVTVHTDSTKNFSVSFPSGYYPEDVSVSGTVGYTGGDSIMFLRSENLTAGAYVFQGLDTGIFPTLTQNLALFLTIFYSLFQSVIGSGYYYMPANIMLVLDSIVFFNGAFYAQSVDMGSTTQVAYSGSDVTGAYRLDMVLESSAAGDKLLSISLTNNGEAVDTSGGLSANVYFTLPVFD